MDINFEQIIEAANQRKNALVALQARVSAVPEILQDIQALHNWGRALEAEIKALDVEAQQMIGHYELRALRILSTVSQYAGQYLNNSDGGVGSGPVFKTTLANLNGEAAS